MSKAQLLVGALHRRDPLFPSGRLVWVVNEQQMNLPRPGRPY
jgi:hypothetical protein